MSSANDRLTELITDTAKASCHLSHLVTIKEGSYEVRQMEEAFSYVTRSTLSDAIDLIFGDVLS